MSDLIQAARAAIEKQYKPRVHVVGAAVRGASGKIYTGINLDCSLRKAAICAEAVAIGIAISAGERDITEIVAVRHPEECPVDDPHCILVVSPCGFCRELIADYGPNAEIHVPHGPEGQITIGIQALLPHRYAKKRNDQAS